MSSFIQKIRKANRYRTTLHFTPKHLQSAEFMQNNVIYSRYVVPRDNFSITPVLEGRCAALTNPSFINTEYHIRGFYVPHSLVWKRFDDYVNGNMTLLNGVHNNSSVPYMTDADLTEIFLGLSHTPVTHTTAEIRSNDYTHTYDFIIQTNNDEYSCYTFTNFGRFAYKLLRSLGYKINFTNDSNKSDRFNAFAFLSYLKVYLDYFVPSLFYTRSACAVLLSKVYESSTQYNVSDASNTDFVNALTELYQNYYPSDLVTAEWRQPQSPLGSSLDNIYSQTGTLTDINEILRTQGMTSYADINNTNTTAGLQTTTLTPQNNLPSTLQNSFGNPWVQRNLQRIADWLTRTRFTGSDKLTNILARFGVKPNNELELRARMVGHFTQPLLVQDITAMAGTEENQLGEFAGKMFAQANNPRTFNFKCDDYGCIIITSMITPRDIDYFEGIDRDICKLSPLEWYQPEFDSMGTQLMSRRELISGITFDIPQTSLGSWTFNNANGYVPRYAEYKHDLCNVSGDFAVNSLNQSARNGTDDSFHHFRSLFKLGKYSPSSGVVLENSLVPNTGHIDDIQHASLAADPSKLSAQSNLLLKAIDKNQYNRIFNVQDNSIDHIYTMYYFNITASRPMKSISDSIDIEDGSNDKIDVSKPVIENFK